MQELMQRSGLDPAAVFGLHRPSLPLGVKEDPAIRYITDHIGRTSSEVQSLRQALFQMQANAQAQVDAENLRLTLQQINNFAEEKDAQGRPTHPYFDDVMPIINDLFKANPQRDLKQAYEQAIWADPKVRELLRQRERSSEQAQDQLKRARQAVRSNTRGITSPVASQRDDSPRGLRATIEAAAEEIGYGT
jgi:regulator of replication initiation timing